MITPPPSVDAKQNTAPIPPSMQGGAARGSTAFFSLGFRPFFLAGAVWAAFAMAAWISVLLGMTALPSRFDPVSWHAHGFLFGYLGAIIAGFLLTAVPNWTGRPPLTGWPLIGLLLFWVFGRGMITFSQWLPPVLVILTDVGFPLIVTSLVLRELIVSRNWRNLVIVVMLSMFILANLLFHLEAERDGYAAQGTGLRLGVVCVMMMIAVIGGRIVPAFTGNWLKKNDSKACCVPPMQRFDKMVLLSSPPLLATWLFWPEYKGSAIALVTFAAMHVLRLLRWKGIHTAAEPLIWVLHIGYGLVPAGALALGIAIWFPSVIAQADFQHLWMAGAIGLMTLAVMTRATLGHTGRALRADRATVLIYLALLASVAVRLCAGVWDAHIMPLHMVSAVLWIAAFGGFALCYGGMLIRPARGAP